MRGLLVVFFALATVEATVVSTVRATDDPPVLQPSRATKLWGKAKSVLEQIRLKHPGASCVPCVFGDGNGKHGDETFYKVTIPATESSPAKELVVDKNDTPVVAEHVVKHESGLRGAPVGDGYS